MEGMDLNTIMKAFYQKIDDLEQENGRLQALVQGNSVSDDIVNRVLALNHPDAADAADEIERLREALALAVGELSTHGEYAAWTPEMLMNQFLEEARRG